MGPISVFPSIGSPNRTFFVSSTTASIKESAIDSITKTRSSEVQTWPAFRKPPQAVPLAAISTSTSSQIMIGSLPPNSKLVFFNCAAAIIAIFFPVSTEPVNAITLVSGCSTKAAPIFPCPVTIFIVPFGK